MNMRAAQERLRLLEFSFEKLPDARCRAKVVLERTAGDTYEGVADGMASQAGELRCAAEATARALQEVAGDRLQFELLGVKAVKAFDASVIIVSLSSREDGPATRLVGSCLVDDDLPKGAALAVLNATNRLLGNTIFMR
jgi:hypothetical protein